MTELFLRVSKWLQVKWSLWRIAVPAVCNGFLSLICYGIGWHFSTRCSSIPLARAGAAATAIAIAFTLYDYRKALQASSQVASQFFKTFVKGLPLTGQESLKRVTEKIQKNTSRAEFVITFVQAIILVLATLIWGFGDLASTWIIGL